VNPFAWHGGSAPCRNEESDRWAQEERVLFFVPLLFSSLSPTRGVTDLEQEGWVLLFVAFFFSSLSPTRGGAAVPRGEESFCGMLKTGIGILPLLR